MSKSLIKVPIGTSERCLIYRKIGHIVLVENMDDYYESPTVLATSKAGCVALAEALKEMVEEINKFNDDR